MREWPRAGAGLHPEPPAVSICPQTGNTESEQYTGCNNKENVDKDELWQEQERASRPFRTVQYLPISSDVLVILP